MSTTPNPTLQAKLQRLADVSRDIGWTDHRLAVMPSTCSERLHLREQLTLMLAEQVQLLRELSTSFPTESELRAIADGFAIGTSGDSAAELDCLDRGSAGLRLLASTLGYTLP